MPSQQPSFLVALGGGAGALYSLARFFKCLPADTGCSFIVLRTIREPGLSMCAAMLGRATDMPVVVASGPVTWSANTVYLVADDHVADISESGMVPVARMAHAQDAANPGRLDVLFDALAATWAERAIGIVLSGDADDGADGSVRLADAGGLILAQAPDTAEAGEMPERAIARGCVHSVLPPVDLAGLVCAFVAGCADPQAAASFPARYAGVRQLQALHRRIASSQLAGSAVPLTRHADDTAVHLAASFFEAQGASLVMDADGIILQVNTAFIELFGHDKNQVVGRDPKFVFAEIHDQRWQDDMRGALARDGAWQGELMCRRRDDAVFPCWHQINAVTDASGNTSHFIATYSDITARRQAEERVRHLAYTDALTGLPNRRLILERLGQRLEISKQEQSYGAVLLLDLERFRTLNNTLGHQVGDRLLVQVARRLRHVLPAIDTVGRLSGDEFLVVLHELNKGPQQAAARAEACAQILRDVLQEPFDINGITIETGASIGICLFSGRETSIDTLLRHTDMALLQARRAGRQMIRFYNPIMQAEVDARTVLDLSLRRAIAQGDLMLMYQPQFDRAGTLMGAEGLIRWRDRERGIVPPAEFIGHAEETGLILPIGRWVLETACQQLVAWSRHPKTRNMRLSVNISPRELRQADFPGAVRELLEETGANPSLLQFELTENVLLDDPEDAIVRMQEIRALGVGISIDDFGTGYSSLSYLKRLPVDQLKIDKSFVNDLVTNEDDAAIVRAIIDMGRSMSLQVFAEGVETRAQYDFLAEHGCDAFQGYLFGKPVAGTSELLASATA